LKDAECGFKILAHGEITPDSDFFFLGGSHGSKGHYCTDTRRGCGPRRPWDLHRANLLAKDHATSMPKECGRPRRAYSSSSN